jgi:hypothetical protein
MAAWLFCYKKRDIVMRSKFFILIMLVSFYLLFTHGGCGGSGGSNGDGGGANELITIEYPTAEASLTEYCDRVTIGGEVNFIPPENWITSDFICTVNWENKTTGDSGNVYCHLIDCDDITCNYTWEASAPLAMGDNFIFVHITDPSGNYGNDSITVTKPDVLTSNISGKVVNTTGDALGWRAPNIELYLKGENIESYVEVGSDGSYSFTCIPAGSYAITPISTLDFNFEPESHTVFVNNGDVSEVDFVTEAYFIQGAVYAECSPVHLYITRKRSDGSQILVTRLLFDRSEQYRLAFPNGTYSMNIDDPDELCRCKCPQRGITIIVNNEDLYDINFSARRPELSFGCTFYDLDCLTYQ